MRVRSRASDAEYPEAPRGTSGLLSGRLRLNLNPLNLVRWIDSWPFDKTWNQVESIQREWIDSTVGLWISSESSSRRRAARERRSRRRRHIFFCKDRAGFDGDRFNAVRLFRVISEDSAERDSLDESSAFLIEGAWCCSIAIQLVHECTWVLDSCTQDGVDRRIFRSSEMRERASVCRSRKKILNTLRSRVLSTNVTGRGKVHRG